MPLSGMRRRIPTARDGFRAIGHIERSWGLNGHVKVRSLTDFPERFAIGATVHIGGIEHSIKSPRWQNGRVYIQLHAVKTSKSAEKLRDTLVEIPEDSRPNFDIGQYYINDIEGCTVRTKDGEELGKISEVLTPGANDVWIVKRKNKRDLLIPAIHDVVKCVDIDSGILIVDLPNGLDLDKKR